MNLLDTVPKVTTTYEFTIEQIKNLISNELDVDPKTVKVHYFTDHNEVVYKLQVVIN